MPYLVITLTESCSCTHNYGNRYHRIRKDIITRRLQLERVFQAYATMIFNIFADISIVFFFLILRSSRIFKQELQIDATGGVQKAYGPLIVDNIRILESWKIVATTRNLSCCTARDTFLSIWVSCKFQSCQVVRVGSDRRYNLCKRYRRKRKDNVIVKSVLRPLRETWKYLMNQSVFNITFLRIWKWLKCDFTDAPSKLLAEF